MTTRAMLVVLVLAVGSLTVAPPAVPAAAKLVFENDKDLKLGWKRLDRGWEFDVCNQGDAAGSLVGRMIGFDFTVQDDPVNTESVLALMPAGRVTIPQGGCTSLVLKSASRRPDGGEYSGVIVLRSGNAAARRALTVVAPRLTATKAAVTVDEVQLEADRNGKGTELELVGDASIPLNAVGARLLVPGKGTTIAVLQNSGHRVYLVVDGKPFVENGSRQLPVRVQGDNEVGTYAGSADLAVGELSAVPIKVKIEASDRLWVPIVLITGSLLVGLVGLLYLQRRRPKRQLFDRTDGLYGRYSAAAAAFDEAYDDATFGAYAPDMAAVEAYQARLRESIRQYAADNFVFKRDSDDFKHLVRDLQKAESDSDFFGDSGGFGAALQQLETMIVRMRDDFPQSAPRFVELAAGRLKGVDLPVGGATKVGAEAKEYIAFADVWRRLATEVARLEAWIQNLQGHDLSEGDRRTFDHARAKVAEAKMELRDSENAARLEEVGAARDVRRAYGQLVVLRSRYGEEPAVGAAAQGARADLRLATRGYEAGIPGQLLELVAQAPGLPIVGWVARTLAQGIRLGTDFAVVAVAVAAAILVALPTIVADETFGTWHDYIAALGLGGTSVLAARGLVDLLSQLRSRERVEA